MGHWSKGGITLEQNFQALGHTYVVSGVQGVNSQAGIALFGLALRMNRPGFVS
jgi:hypothetical protein